MLESVEIERVEGSDEENPSACTRYHGRVEKGQRGYKQFFDELKAKEEKAAKEAEKITAEESKKIFASKKPDLRKGLPIDDENPNPADELVNESVSRSE